MASLLWDLANHISRNYFIFLVIEYREFLLNIGSYVNKNHYWNNFKPFILNWNNPSLSRIRINQCFTVVVGQVLLLTAGFVELTYEGGRKLIFFVAYAGLTKGLIHFVDFSKGVVLCPVLFLSFLLLPFFPLRLPFFPLRFSFFDFCLPIPIVVLFPSLTSISVRPGLPLKARRDEFPSSVTPVSPSLRNLPWVAFVKINVDRRAIGFNEFKTQTAVSAMTKAKPKHTLKFKFN